MRKCVDPTIVAVLFLLGCKSERQPNAPTVDGPATGHANVPVSFVVQTTDPDGDDVAYLFNWGDGTNDSWTIYYASGQSISRSHRYSSSGSYDLVAKAQDANGLQSDWSTIRSISISSRPPNPPSTPTGPTVGVVDSAYYFSTSAIDPDNDSVSFQFDWGDGSGLTWTPYYASGRRASVSHVFTTPDTYNIRAKARDVNEVESDWSPTLTVAVIVDRAPGAPATPSGASSGRVNTEYTFVSLAEDPDGDSVALRFDWGDGDTSDWTPWVPSGRPVTSVHSWQSIGVYQVRAQAQDKYGAFSDWSSPHQIDIVAARVRLTDDMTYFPSGWSVVPPSSGWTRTSSRYNSAPYSAKCTPYSSYSNNMDVAMTWAVSLAGAEDCSLSFRVWQRTESGYDYVRAEYYSGGDWTTVWTRTGNYPTWEGISLSIPNTTTLIRFRFDSDNSEVDEGVYIDDVEVSSIVD